MCKSLHYKQFDTKFLFCFQILYSLVTAVRATKGPPRGPPRGPLPAPVEALWGPLRSLWGFRGLVPGLLFTAAREGCNLSSSYSRNRLKTNEGSVREFCFASGNEGCQTDSDATPSGQLHDPLIPSFLSLLLWWWRRKFLCIRYSRFRHSGGRRFTGPRALWRGAFCL